MSEDKKEETGSCSSGRCCGCKGIKLLVGLLMGAFIFASGMWFAKAHCHCHGGNFCPFSAPQATK